MSSELSNAEVVDLYKRYGHLVLRRTRVMLRDAQLAEDVLQSVFLKVMRNGASIRGADSQLAWLYRAVDRCCFDLIDQLRRRERRERYRWFDSAESRPSIEERSFLSALWHRLDPQERAVAMLLYSDGLSQDEASHRLGWSRQTINKKAMAIRQLANDLAREMEAAK